MSYLSTIRTQLKTLLDAVVTDNDISAVYDYEPKTLTVLPCAVLRFTNSSSQVHDTAANLRTVEFTVRVYTKVLNTETAEDDLVAVVESVIAKIEHNPTLTNTVLQTVCRQSAILADERDVPVIYSDISVECQLRVNR